MFFGAESLTENGFSNIRFNHRKLMEVEIQSLANNGIQSNINHTHLKYMISEGVNRTKMQLI